MANTEGIPDEHLASLLSLPPPSINPNRNSNLRSRRKDRLLKRDQALKAQQTNSGAQQLTPVPAQTTKNEPSTQLDDIQLNSSSISSNVNSHPPQRAAPKSSRFRKFSRQDMMDLPDGMTPSAKVIRSSSSKKTSQFKSQQHQKQKQQSTSVKINIPTDPIVQEQNIVESDPKPNPVPSINGTTSKTQTSVILSECIIERPISQSTIQSQNKHMNQPRTPKVSRFKQQRIPKENGFPSLDLPLGTFLPPKVKKPSPPSHPKVTFSETNTEKKTNKTSNADDVLSSMSQDQIQQSVQELQSTLSPELLSFLKQRGKQKQLQKSPTKSNSDRTAKKSIDHKMKINSKEEDKEDIITENQLLQEKTKTAQILASIQTEEDLDKAMSQISLTSTLPTSNIPHDTSTSTNSDIHTATSLLRSSSSHQRLLAAKTISTLLQSKVQATQTHTLDNLQDYPKVLPVALRCLLDLPSPKKHLILFHHVLETFLSLLQLFAFQQDECVIQDSPAFFYQSYYMEDSIPTSTTTKITSDIPIIQDSKNPAYYTTDSSAQSATLDGVAFYKDPAWTLLSRMRIIPCLANIMQSCCSTTPKISSRFSPEHWISICHILNKICLRSPGAACAIGQHPRIISLIVENTLSVSEKDDGFLVSTNVAVPTLMLLNTLARQSRVLASSEYPYANVMTILMGILGMEAHDSQERMVQFHAIVLWRTLLRYGLAIPHLSTFLSISTPHLYQATRTQSSPYLQAEYLTCFANICECAKIITRSSSHSIQPKQIKLTLAQRETLALAGGWLSSQAQQSSTMIANTSQNFSSQNMKSIAAHLRFLSSFITAVAPTPLAQVRIDEEKEEVLLGSIPSEDLQNVLLKGTFHSMLSMERCIDSLSGLLKGDPGTRLLDVALENVLRSAFVFDWKEQSSNGDLQLEAGCASMVKSLSTFLWNLSTAEFLHVDKEDSKHSHLLQELMIEFGYAIILALDKRSIEQHSESIANVELTNSISAPRKGWLNGAHCFLAKFLGFYLRQKHLTEKVSKEYSIARVFVFCLLGRLQPGEEALAAMILSEDIQSPIESYQKSTFTNDENILFPGPIQKVLIRELCSTKQARNQLLHSAKVCRSIGFTADARGPFALESLRSQVDRVLPTSSKSDEEEDNSSKLPGIEQILPLGQDWLWHVLSSTIQPIDFEKEELNKTSNELDLKSRGAQMLQEASRIVSSCLKLLNEMESEDEIFSNLFINKIEQGFKLYHISNVCMFPEEILRNDTIEELFLSLFLSISCTCENIIGPSPLIPAFMNACYQHSKVSQSRHEKQKDLETPKSKDEKESEEKLLYGSLNSANQAFSNLEIRSFQDFMQDMMDTFQQYGAQYKLFVLCIRFLLRPGFPPSVLSKTIQKLKETIHLLTLEEQTGAEDAQSMMFAFSGGLPSKDGSRRDTPDLLDAFASLLLKKKKAAHGDTDETSSTSSLETQYLYQVGIGYLGRNLASSIQRCECGVGAAKKRLSQLDSSVLCDVFLTCKYLLESPTATKKDLVEIIQHVCVPSFEKKDLKLSTDINIILECIDKGIDKDSNWEESLSSIKN